MSNKTLLAVLRAAEKAGPSHNYCYEDRSNYWEITEAAYNKAQVIEGYNFDAIRDAIEDVSDSSEDVQDDDWTLYSPAQLKAIKRQLEPVKLYRMMDTDANLLVFTESQYKAIKQVAEVSYRFWVNEFSFEVVVDRLNVKIGCQEYTLDEWQADLDDILSSNLDDPAKEARAKVAFQAALPYLDRMQGALKLKHSRKKGPKKAKK
jgi:hypothetical protein